MTGKDEVLAPGARTEVLRLVFPILAGSLPLFDLVAERHASGMRQRVRFVSGIAACLAHSHIRQVRPGLE